MSTKTKPAAESAEELARRFAELVAHCHRDTGHSSRMKDKVAHPAFREIVAMGENAVPLLLASIEKGPPRLASLLALAEITGAEPMPDDASAWLAWGRAQGYRWEHAA